MRPPGRVTSHESPPPRRRGDSGLRRLCPARSYGTVTVTPGGPQAQPDSGCRRPAQSRDRPVTRSHRRSHLSGSEFRVVSRPPGRGRTVAVAVTVTLSYWPGIGGLGGPGHGRAGLESEPHRDRTAWVGISHGVSRHGPTVPGRVLNLKTRRDLARLRLALAGLTRPAARRRTRAGRGGFRNPGRPRPPAITARTRE